MEESISPQDGVTGLQMAGNQAARLRANRDYLCARAAKRAHRPSEYVCVCVCL